MIKIVADTLTSIPLDQARELGIAMLPQLIIFGEEVYRDDTEIDTETFLRKLRASPTLPTTSAPPPELYRPIYQQLLDEGHEVFCLGPSAELSHTVQSAYVAAQEFEGPIRIIDTRSIGGPFGTMVLLAHQWAREGADADTIEARVRDLMARQRIYFVVDTLEYLHKGGRIGGARALLGSVLQIKPILHIQNGRVEPFEQQRTKSKALARLRELIVTECPHSPDAYPCVMHADAEEDARALAGYLSAELGVSEVPVFVVPPAIVVHAGPGVLGAGFFVRP